MLGVTCCEALFISPVRTDMVESKGKEVRSFCPAQISDMKELILAFSCATSEIAL